ncbi:hypothetical protein [Mesorhizobium sp. ORM8.1]
MLEIVLRLLTTGSVFVGATAVYAAMHNHTRQINTQIFLAYSDRLQSIRRSMRSDLLATRAVDKDMSDDSEIPAGAMETLHLIFELFELRDQGYVRTSIWTVWSRDIDRFLNAPKIRHGREQIRREFEGHRKFIAWMDQRLDVLVARTSATPRPANQVS